MAELLHVEAAAERINMAASKGKVWKWMNGVRPDRVTQLLLARKLGVDPAEVDRRPWPEWLPAYHGIRTELSSDHNGVLRAMAEAGDGVDVDRRGFLILTGAQLVAFAGADVMADVPMTGELGPTVDGELLTDIEDGVPRLRRMEAKLGGAHVQHLVDGELRTVIGLLRGARYTTSEGRRLHRTVAELARVAGWAAFDGQRHAAAQRYWALGLFSARAAGDRLIAANILKSMSLQCLDFGHTVEALQIAEATASGLRSASPRVSTMFTLRRARALAAQGDRNACVRLIAATDADTAVSYDGDPDWIAYFDAAEYCAQVGSCYLELGDAVTADRWLDDALAAMPATKTRDTITYLLRRASVHALTGDVPAATAFAQQALPMMGNAPSARNDMRLGELRDLLGSRGAAGRSAAAQLEPA
ncbi:transcriptional regulator [Catellatospora sp. NPDC049133]|uniref:transcriptional regulator n=1 Tax=Catellatospora sp. NPDC049133 TaxID=3155499 RepID=UPI0033FBF34E